MLTHVSVLRIPRQKKNKEKKQQKPVSRPQERNKHCLTTQFGSFAALAGVPTRWRIGVCQMCAQTSPFYYSQNHQFEVCTEQTR